MNVAVRRLKPKKNLKRIWQRNTRKRAAAAAANSLYMNKPNPFIF